MTIRKSTATTSTHGELNLSSSRQKRWARGPSWLRLSSVSLAGSREPGAGLLKYGVIKLSSRKKESKIWLGSPSPTNARER
jgi:hypothetical protein